MFSRRPATAFTLVELLVVLAIVALLTGILIPSLQGVRRSARTTICAAHLKQVATGWTVYAQQSNGALVPGRMPKIAGSDNVYWVGNGYQYRPRWYIQMGAEAGFWAYDRPSVDPADDNIKTIDNTLFTCPERPEWINNRNYTYGYNYQFLGNSRFKLDADGTADPTQGFINFPVAIGHLRTVTSTVMAADTLGTSATFAAAARRPYNVSGTDNQLDQRANHGWSLDPPRLTEESDFCDNKHRNEARSAADPRHAGKANFLFCDTHVELLEPREAGYRAGDDGAHPLPGAAADGADAPHNRLFSGSGRDSDPPRVFAD